MAVNEILRTFTVEAAADLSTKQFFLVAIDGSGQAAVAGDGVPAYPLQNKPDAQGKAASLGLSGRSKVVASGVIDEGNDIASDAAGKAKVAATGDHILGVALKPAAADGEVIEYLVDRGGRAV
jgi:hypothetical protein